MLLTLIGSAHLQCNPPPLCFEVLEWQYGKMAFRPLGDNISHFRPRASGTLYGNKSADHTNFSHRVP